MKTVSDLIDKWPSMQALADDLGHRNASTVSSWKIRGSIHHRNWPSIIAAAKKRGISGVNLASLAQIAITEPKTSPEAA